MPDIALTPEQQRAVETLDGDLLVSAGAGTGKTRVLTERFIHVVESGRAAVDEILTLTFTEKAAREMKERIVRRLTELGRERERRQVESAYIGTIHSFCARVLRENALEAGVDPYFTQLDEAAAAIIQRQVFDDLLAGGEGPGRTAAFALLADFEARSLREVVFALYGRMRSLGKAPGDLQIAPAQDTSAAADAARAAVQQVLGLARESTSSALGDMLAALRDSLDRINALLGAREFAWETCTGLDEASRLFKLNVGTKDQKPVVAQAKQSILTFCDALLSHRAAEQALALRELLRAFDEAYTAAKDEEGQLDFADLLVRARDLFGTPEQPTPTALRYREQFKFLLMDEFQDTNRLQFSVVEPIVPPQRRFTVGDAKQSIYRFLYADVAIFLQRDQKLAETGGKLPPLSRNFRSHPDLLGFTNAFFRDLWAEDDFPFGELAPGKTFGKRAEPRVEILLVAGAENARDAREREAQLVARRVAEITGFSGSPAMTLTEDGKERAACFRDILILFRATSDIQLYEDALHDYDIPYYTVRGRGFFQTQEVLDLRNLLAVLENPLDDVAMAAVLRSPLVGVSDEALYWLGAPSAYADRDEDELPPQGTGRIAARLERAGKLANLTRQDAERLAAFREMLADLRQSAAGTRVADLLDDAIRRTDYDLKSLCQRNGRRRYANIEKLRQIALSFQSQARFSLRDFLDYLETLEVVAEREAEAATEAEEADVVRLMTIHAAKGLEAPIVIVADLSRRSQYRAEPAVLSGAGDLAVKLRNPFTDAVVEPPDYAALRDGARAADLAETKRLLYVACTRAKEHLLLSGSLAEDNDSESSPGPSRRLARPYNELSTWVQWVTKFLGLEEAPPPEGELVRRDGFTALIRSDVRPPAVPPARPSVPLLKRFRERIEAGEALDLSLIAAGCDVDGLCREAQAVAERIASAAVRGSTQVTVSVTGAMRYQSCPRLYELSVIDRLPENDRPADPTQNLILDREDEFDPRDRGTRLHELLCQVDFRANANEEVERLAVGWTEGEQADAGRALERFRGTELWQRLARSGEVLRETPFVIKSGDGLLRGQIDVLMREGEEWTLMDYKTGAQHDGEYEDQLLLYALACRALLGATPARGIIYYLDLGEAQEVSVDDAALDRAAAELREVLRGIAAGGYPRREGEACTWCAFKTTCRS